MLFHGRKTFFGVFLSLLLLSLLTNNHPTNKKQPIHIAATKGDVAMIECLLDLGANIDDQSAGWVSAFLFLDALSVHLFLNQNKSPLSILHFLTPRAMQHGC